MLDYHVFSIKHLGLHCYIAVIYFRLRLSVSMYCQENKGNQTWMKPYIEQYQVILANVVLFQHPLDVQIGVEEAEEWRGWLQIRHHGPQLGGPGDAGP